MKEAYDAKKWAFVTDYARLDILYRYGGIYLDTDVEIIRSFDPLLVHKAFAGFEDTGLIALGLGIGAEPGNPVVKSVLDSYSDHHFTDQDGNMDLTPNPTFNTPVFEKIGVRIDGSYQELTDITVFPVDYFCPKESETGILKKTKNTYSIHHYATSWHTEEQNRLREEYWAKKQSYIKKQKKRERKLAFRKKYGGFFRKIFSDDGWEKIKSVLIKGYSKNK